jgi:hypothetical protein
MHPFNIICPRPDTDVGFTIILERLWIVVFDIIICPESNPLSEKISFDVDEKEILVATACPLNTPELLDPAWTV